MTAPTSSADAGLLFNWEAPRRRSLLVLGFLGASIVLHAACFYLFQVVYPPAVALLPPPARVNLITPNSEEGRSLLRWIDAEDPALASATQRPPDARQRALPKVPHVPSYMVEEPRLKPIPASVPDTRAPTSQPPGPVQMFHRPPPAPLGPVPTQVKFSEELAGLGDPHLAPPRFIASNHEAPQAVRFRVAISPRGEVRYCFPLNSSGDPALDEQGRHYLVLARFTWPAGGDAKNLTWGMASLEWGNDVAPPSSIAPAPATP